MPAIHAPGGPVDWPENEGTLGVVGVAPWATLEFCRAFYSLVNASKDWHYPRVLLDINTKLPSRGRHLELGETDPSPYIAATISELTEAGATVVVVPCNTAHILYDRWAGGASVLVPNIITETVRCAVAAGGKNIVSLNSAGLSRAGKYAQAIEAEKGKFHALTSDQQSVVTRCIERVKQHGKLDSVHRSAILDLGKVLKASGCDAILLGCTELSETKLMLEQCGLVVVDSNEALAIVAAKKIKAIK